MSEIKPWRDRAPKETTSFDYPRVCRETADAEIAELRARVAQQAAMVEKCMVAMNENAARGMAAEARVAELEKGEPVAWQYQSREGIWHTFMNEKHRADTEADGTWPIRALFTHPAPAREPISDAEIFDIAGNYDCGTNGENMEWTFKSPKELLDFSRALLEKAR